MELRIKNIKLFTGDLNRYAQFLSNLFEIELKDNSFEFSNFTITLHQDPHFKLDTQYATEFSIDIMQDEFDDFKAKYEFYSFRILNMEANIDIQSFNGKKYFTIYDPDMRVVKVYIS